MALSEALANAIIYGNCNDSGKSVEVKVVVTSKMVAVHVSDEGDGFNPDEIPNPTLPDGLDQTSGRGLFLIREMVDEVRFNEKGNSICMMMSRASPASLRPYRLSRSASDSPSTNSIAKNGWP